MTVVMRMIVVVMMVIAILMAMARIVPLFDGPVSHTPDEVLGDVRQLEWTPRFALLTAMPPRRWLEGDERNVGLLGVRI